MEMSTKPRTAVIDGRTYTVGTPAFERALKDRNNARREHGRVFLARFAAEHGIDYDTMTVRDMALAAGWDDLR